MRIREAGCTVLVVLNLACCIFVLGCVCNCTLPLVLLGLDRSFLSHATIVHWLT